MQSIGFGIRLLSVLNKDDSRYFHLLGQCLLQNQQKHGNKGKWRKKKGDTELRDQQNKEARDEK